MASLDTVLECYMHLQNNRDSPDISYRVASNGYISIPFTDLMLCAGIEDESELMEYAEYIRKDAEVETFRKLVDLSYSTYPRDKVKKTLYFDITKSLPVKAVDEAIADDSSVLLQNEAAEEAIEPPEKTIEPPEEAIEPPIANDYKTPERVRRVSRKSSYSKQSLEKLSGTVESDFWKNVIDKFPSEHLRKQVVAEVVKRLNYKVNGDATDDCKVIVSNIKSLVDAMTIHGRSDREQIHFMENLALAVTGGISYQKLRGTTGLSKRVLVHERQIRSKFDEVTAKAELEISNHRINHEIAEAFEPEVELDGDQNDFDHVEVNGDSDGDHA
jgi:hypothetical protein